MSEGRKTAKTCQTANSGEEHQFKSGKRRGGQQFQSPLSLPSKAPLAWLGDALFSPEFVPLLDSPTLLVAQQLPHELGVYEKRVA